MQRRWTLRDYAVGEGLNTVALEHGLETEHLQLLWARGLRDVDSVRSWMDKSIHRLVKPSALSQVEQAVERIVFALKKQERILVHGDFDADGLTSAALLSLFLKEIGANVLTYIPNRLEEGHGISQKAIALATKEDVSLLITCDCGSSNLSEIQILRAQGVDVIVTDHHTLGDSEQADAILVNPQQDPGGMLTDLTGVGVVFMLCMALRAQLRSQGYFSEARKEPNLKSYLDIVALGTIADMAMLVGQNRLLVSAGLEVLQKTTRCGIVAMKDVAGLQADVAVSSEDVGFRLAPRINAAARLGHADEALALLMCDRPLQAYALAQRLEAHNQRRKAEQERMFDHALAQARRQYDEGAEVLVVAHASYHPGLVGLLAQKLAEQFFRPVFAFALEGDLARGSARSRQGVHLVTLMSQAADLLLQYGGHAQAGGCTLPQAKLSEFAVRLRTFARSLAREVQPELLIDAVVEPQRLSMPFVEKLKALGPFGRGFEEPCMALQLPMHLEGQCLQAKHVKCVWTGPSQSLEIIAFNQWESWQSRDRRHPVWIAFTPEISTWKSKKKLQLRVHDMKNFPFGA